MRCRRGRTVDHAFGDQQVADGSNRGDSHAEDLGDVSGSMGARFRLRHGTQVALLGRHQSVRSHAEETRIQLGQCFALSVTGHDRRYSSCACPTPEGITDIRLSCAKPPRRLLSSPAQTDPEFAFKIDPPFPGGLLSSDIGRRARDGGKRTTGASVQIPTYLTAIPVTSDGPVRASTRKSLPD